MKTEPITKAEQTAEFLRADLREALRNATAVEAILVLELIGAAEDLRRRIAELLGAVESESWDA
jgi:hypothetical protein